MTDAAGAVTAAGDAAIRAAEVLAEMDSEAVPAAMDPQAARDEAGPQEPLVEDLDAAEAAELKAGLRPGAEAEADEEVVPSVTDMDPAELRGVLEAVMLVATKPLKLERLAKLLPGVQPRYLEGFLRGLAARYTVEGRGWDLREIAGGWQLLTRVDYHPWVRQLDRKELPSKLTKSAMETLAIIAYKQPISRGQVDDIRGVQSGPMLRTLMEMKLVQVVGRSEELLGKPLLYGTTEVFLDRFGLGSPDDLPRRHELGG